jgi:serine/threonine protein kinase
MAPEILASERDYDEKVDVWAFGALLCEVFTTQLSYTDSKGQSFFQLVKVAEESQVRSWGACHERNEFYALVDSDTLTLLL